MAARPQPEPDELSAPFWAAARTNHLVLQRCRVCDVVVFPPLSHCPRCRQRTLVWKPHPMTGRVHAWARTHTTVVEGIDAPYTTVSVEMDDASGVQLFGFLSHADDVDIGAGVCLEFVDVEGTPTATFHLIDDAPGEP